MVDQNQVNAMADILAKLGNTSNSTPTQTPTEKKTYSDPTSMAAQTDAMADILRKLESSTQSAAETIVTESKRNPDLGFAVNASREVSGAVSVARYEIVPEKKTVSESFNKTFYSVVDNKTGQVLYNDLGLFESAMGIVKHMAFTGKQSKIDRLVELDTAYVGHMVETYGYKKKMSRLNESSVQYDVTSAKYSNSKEKMAGAKLRILKAL